MLLQSGARSQSIDRDIGERGLLLLLPSLTDLKLTLRGDGYSDGLLAAMVVERAASASLQRVNIAVTKDIFSFVVFQEVLLPVRKSGRVLLEISDVDGCLLSRLHVA